MEKDNWVEFKKECKEILEKGLSSGKKIKYIEDDKDMTPVKYKIMLSNNQRMSRMGIRYDVEIVDGDVKETKSKYNDQEYEVKGIKCPDYPSSKEGMLNGYGFTTPSLNRYFAYGNDDRKPTHLHLTLHEYKKDSDSYQQRLEFPRGGWSIGVGGCIGGRFEHQWSIQLWLNKYFINWSFEGMENFHDENYEKLRSVCLT